MEFDWSVINRIKYYIGELHFKNELGSEFLSLLNNHKFDEASKMIIKKNVFNDKEL